MARDAEEWRDFAAPFDVLRQTVEQVLREDIRAKNLEWSQMDKLVTARTPFSFAHFLTLGELLTIAVDPCGEVWVQSEGQNARNWIDFGRNRYNCKRVLYHVARRLGEQFQ